MKKDNKYPVCFKCNILNPYCVCDKIYSKKYKNYDPIILLGIFYLIVLLIILYNTDL